MSKQNNKYSYREILFLSIIFSLLGLLIGIIGTKQYETKFGSSSSVHEFLRVYDDIKNHSYYPVDKDKMIEAGIAGMINYLNDDYADFLSKDIALEFNQKLDGKFVGLGITVKFEDDGTLSIVDINKNSPAEKAHLLVNDIIFKINDKETKNMTYEDILNYMRGKKGTSGNLTVKRNNQILDIKFVRDLIEIKSVKAKRYDDIAYLKIDIFAKNTANQFKDELEKLEKEKVKKVIIDVRNNNGGHLEVAEKMSRMLLNKGDIIYGLKEGKKKTTVKAEKDSPYNFDIVIIGDKTSASGAELLIGALIKNKKAYFIGSSTYGKGTVQRSYNLKNGSTIKYTIEEWLIPDGTSINKKGIKPDKEVKQDRKYYDTGLDSDDKLLQEAIKILKNK